MKLLSRFPKIFKRKKKQINKLPGTKNIYEEITSRNAVIRLPGYQSGCIGNYLGHHR